MQDRIRKARKKSIFWGMLSGIFFLSIYFIIVSVANSLAHAVNEFLQLWYWITALTIGFGVQVGFYVHVRQTIQLKKQAFGATSTMVAAGGVSTVSMLACCAHHVTDFLPILGLSAAAVRWSLPHHDWHVSSMAHNYYIGDVADLDLCVL